MCLGSLSLRVALTLRRVAANNALPPLTLLLYLYRLCCRYNVREHFVPNSMKPVF